MYEDKEIGLLELYDLVWTTPMSQLASEFGVSDRGLAKLCKKHGIPTPPRGYWVKIEAGKPVCKPSFPSDVASPTKTILLPSGYKAPSEAVSFRRDRKHLELAMKAPVLPSHSEDLHHIVSDWIVQYVSSDNKKKKVDTIDLFTQESSKLTEADIFRLKVTSAFLRAVEAGGAVIENSEVWGRITLKIGAAELVARIMQKMSPQPRIEPDYKNWTAWPEHHVNGHFPTKDLKFTVEGRCIPKVEYVLGRVEVNKGGLKKVVASVLAAEKAAERWVNKQHLEAERLAAEAAHVQRLRQKVEEEEARWNRFDELFRNWERSERQRQFLDQLKRKAGCGLTEIVDGRPLSQWIDWARRKVDEHDPTNEPDQVFRLPKKNLDT